MVKTKQAIVIALVVVLIVCGGTAFGCLTWNTIRHAGDQAVAQMNSDEREWLKRVTLIHPAMNAEQVYKVLGEPTSDILLLAKWDGFGGSQLSQLRIYFFDGHPRRIRWLKLGYFMYEKDL